MNALLPELAKRPDVLFVYVTAPPLAGDSTRPAWKYALRSLARRPDSGALAREFDDWMTSPDGWLSHYASSNVVVFDYFDVLTGHGQSNRLVYPSGNHDSHPTSAGNSEATKAFVPFLNRALHRAGGGVTASRSTLGR